LRIILVVDIIKVLKDFTSNYNSKKIHCNYILFRSYKMF